MDIFRAWCHTKWMRTFKQKHTWSVDHFGSDDAVLRCEQKSSTPFTATGHDISLRLTYEVKDREGPLENREKTEKYFEIELHAKLGATMSSNALLIGKLKLIKSSEAVEDFGGK